MCMIVPRLLNESAVCITFMEAQEYDFKQLKQAYSGESWNNETVLKNAIKYFCMLNPNKNKSTAISETKNWLNSIDEYLNENITTWNQVVVLSEDLNYLDRLYFKKLKNIQKRLETIIVMIEKMEKKSKRTVLKVIQSISIEDWIEQIQLIKSIRLIPCRCKIDLTNKP